MVADAWAADYVGHARINIERRFLRRMLQTPRSLAVVVYASSGEPVGLELGIERTVHCADTKLNAYYVTAFSVSPRYRRQGVGRWVLEGINDLVFNEQGADIVFSTFHIGHAGSPTVQHTYDAIGSLEINRFWSSPLYGLRFGKWSPPKLTRADGTRVSIDERGQTQFANGKSATIFQAFSEDAIKRCGAYFGFNTSFGEFYLKSAQTDSGSLWYNLGDGQYCWITYSLLPLAWGHTPIGNSGQLQTVLSTGLSNEDFGTVLNDVAHRFREAGCVSMTMLDQGAVPLSVLTEIGLVATDTEITFCARGPAENVRPFSQTRKPHLLDFC